MQGSTVQIQTVLYKMDHPSLFRALDSVANALRVDREGPCSAGLVTVVHGDASPEPTFTPEEAAAIKERYASSFVYEYVYFNENTGTSRGHNKMFETCTSDYLVVQNPDIQYCPHFFDRMLAPFERNDVRVGLVEARQTPIEHPKTYDPVTKVTDWSTGACFMARSSVYREVGGFDADSFFMYCDDVDLSWRIRLAGYSLIYQPLAPVYHPKYLSDRGRWQATVAEAYYSAEALLFMSYKYSFKKRLARLLKIYQTSGDEMYERVAKSFIERQEAGALPEQLDPNHTVADINETGYASRRFTM